MTQPPDGDLREPLRALFDALFASPAAAGYTLRHLAFGETLEAVAEKGGASFVLWLRSVNDDTNSFRKTTAFKIGYRDAVPDPGAYKLLDALAARLATWELAHSPRDLAQLFRAPRLAEVASPAEANAGPVASLLAEATFTPLHGPWLAEREQRVLERLRAMAPRPSRVLLVNATKGLPYYASIGDFFLMVKEAHPEVGVTSASYFEEIYQFHTGLARKGMETVSIAALERWGAEEFNRFDVVLHVGPSDVLARLMVMPGLTARQTMLDLAFYHQLIDAHRDPFYRGEDLVPDKHLQRNRVICYSCQPASKVRRDLAGFCDLDLLDWRWFSYIPLGFSYYDYYRSDRQPFDVALLGRASRDYGLIDPAQVQGLRFLFVGSMANAPELERLRAEADVTVVPPVDQGTYARLLALCRCTLLPVIVPAHERAPGVANVLMSVVDTLASGKPLVTSPHDGLRRLAAEGVPAVFYDPADPADLARQLRRTLEAPGLADDLGGRALAFARDRMDIYRILETIVTEQIL